MRSSDTHVDRVVSLFPSHCRRLPPQP